MQDLVKTATDLSTSAAAFSKSAADFYLSIAVFTFSQSGKVFRGLPTKDPAQIATERFDATTPTITDQFDSIDNSLYSPVKTIQDALIDSTFSFFTPNTFNPETIAETTQNVLRWGLGLAYQLIPGGVIGTGGPPAGWGPVNEEDAQLF